MSEKKYPRTYHLTFSEGCTDDDKQLDNDNNFINREIIITAKLDGSNFMISSNSCFARSHNGPPTHKSFDYGKAIHNTIKFNIPNNLEIYTEYLFAKHSIHYNNLSSYIYIFNILNILSKKWLSWYEVEFLSEKLNIPTVPVLFKGIIKSNKELKNICLSLMKEKEFGVDQREGIVIRIADEFNANVFASSIAKAVRANHVQTSDHWRSQEIVKNGLVNSK